MIRDAGRGSVFGADLLELRFDRLWHVPSEDDASTLGESSNEGAEPPSEAEPEMKTLDDVNVTDALDLLKEGIDRPVIFSCLPVGVEDGCHPGTMADRESVLMQAIETGVSWIEVDDGFDDDSTQRILSSAIESGTQIVRSIRSNEHPPEGDEISSLVQSLSEGADLVRLVYSCGHDIHGLRLVEGSWELVNSDSPPSYSIMGRGRTGDWTSLHAPILGQSIVFTVLTEDPSLSSKGQIGVKEVRVAWEVLEYL